MHVCICVHVQMLVGVGRGEGDGHEAEQIKPREEDRELRDVREEGKKVTGRRIPKSQRYPSLPSEKALTLLIKWQGLAIPQ